MALKALKYVELQVEVDEVTNKVIADKTVTCWALDFQKMVGDANFPVKGKLEFYTELVKYINTKEGGAMLFKELGVEYSSLIRNPSYAPTKPKKPKPGEPVVAPTPAQLKAMMKYLPPTDVAKVPSVKFV